MKIDDETIKAMAICIALVVGFSAVLIFGSLFSAHMESETYNKLTGAHTTWWDALWVELRIQAQPK